MGGGMGGGMGMLTFCVSSWVIPHLLTGVDMNPPPLVLAVHLGPDMVFTIPDPSYPGTGSTAQHAETVGKFTCSSSASLEKGPYFAISRESFKGPAVRTSALI